MSTTTTKLLMQPRRRILDHDSSPTRSVANFLNTPIQTRNQLKLGSVAGSSMVSPYPGGSTRKNIIIGGDFKDVANNVT
jgi:hypothetical protein